MIHWQTAVTATTITKRIASVFNAPKSTAPFPTILSTICPVMIGAYKVRTTDIAAQVRERTTKKLYRLIYFNILPSVFLLTDVLFSFLLMIVKIVSYFYCLPNYKKNVIHPKFWLRIKKAYICLSIK